MIEKLCEEELFESRSMHNLLESEVKRMLWYN